jgi:hypothetical protein
MKLTTLNNTINSWEELQDGEYGLLTEYKTDNKCSLIFKCLGCGKPLTISIIGGSTNTWRIDFETLTAKPSILHDREKGGCGWHGYLTNGLLEGKIE